MGGLAHRPLGSSGIEVSVLSLGSWLPLRDVLTAVTELMSSGAVRARGIVNWPAARVAEAGRIAHELNVPPPCAAQLPYNLVSRSWVDEPEMTEAQRLCSASVIASYVLADQLAELRAIGA